MISGTKSNTLDNPNLWKVLDKITVIDQARRSYIDHYVPISGSGIAVANGLIEVTIFIT